MEQCEFEERVKRAAQQTWQAIGGDVFAAAQVDTLERDEVVECVLEHIETYGRDREAVEQLKTLPDEEQVAVATKAFPFERFGF